MATREKEVDSPKSNPSTDPRCVRVTKTVEIRGSRRGASSARATWLPPL